MELLFTQEQYNNFINDSTDDIMKNIYFNDIFNYEERSYEVDYPKYINFCKTLEYYYFLFLKEQVFDLISDNSDDIYLKIRNKNDKIFLHANKIYDFYLDNIVLDGLKYHDMKVSLSNNDYHKLDDYYIEYMNIYNQKIEIIRTLVDDNIEDNFYDPTELLQIFYNKFNNEIDFYNSIKDNSLFIEKNQKKCFSDYFINKITFLFFIDIKNIDIIDIEYDQNFLDNFIFSPFRF